MKAPIIYWFRNDLRLSDLPGLEAARSSGAPILACYILDDETPGDWAIGKASRWWLTQSLSQLASCIEAQGGTLHFAKGRTEDVLSRLAQTHNAEAVYCSRQYEPWSTAIEQRLHKAFSAKGVEFKRYHGALLWEPEHIQNKAGKPFRVFTPFWRACANEPPPLPPQKTSTATNWHNKAERYDDVKVRNSLLAQEEDHPNWGACWSPGEHGANRRLDQFIADNLENYSDSRDFPAQAATSQLSPHFHFGEISPGRVLSITSNIADKKPELAPAVHKFQSELGWREFSHHLLYHFPDIPDKALRPTYRFFPAVGTTRHLTAWQHGLTGYPLVDAGMRELESTGFMQNRVRMITASFLCKHLLVDWREGQKWFWQKLVDADLANNACSWQWVFGSGADAAPYFRIFNPVTQGQKFDPAGDYIRQWVPEIASLPDRFLHSPWLAPTAALDACASLSGQPYPPPIVDHRAAREAALNAYKSLSEQAENY